MKNNEIYIGRKAGKELFEDIHNAKKSVKIISPYLGPEYVKDLIGIKEKGVEVSLITSDNVETNNHVEFNHKDIILQNKHTNEQAFQERKALFNYLIGASITALVSLFLSFSVAGEFFILVLISGITAAILYFIYTNKVVYTYDYHSLFNIRVLFSQYCSQEQKNDFLVHSKVYIIDDKVAYMGSVNFTFSGIENSFECITKIKDKEQIEYLNQEYKKLFHNKRLKSKDINEWGKELYLEPIN